MRFFTWEWWEACQDLESDFDMNGPAEGYQEYLVTIAKHLPQELRAFLERYLLHDAGLVALRAEEGEVHLELLVQPAEDVSGKVMRQARCRLTYTRACLHLSCEQSMTESLGEPGFGDLGYDELRWDGQRLEHSFLFSSGVEMCVDFDEFRWEELSPAEGAEVPEV